VLLAGCSTRPHAPDDSTETQTTQPANSSTASEKTRNPLAYVNGQPVTQGQLFEPLVEAAGGRVLTEIVLNRMVRERLEQRGIELTEKQIQAERQLVLQALASDENQSVVLLQQMRRRSGLGKRRFQALLRRNAGLRQLVQDEVEVSDAALRQAHERQYGPRYEGRILVTARAREARRLRQKITKGTPFATAAARHSTDPSAAQGGLLSPISPADASYPQIIRETLTELKPGEISQVIAVQDGYALLKLERKIEGRSVKLADVEDALTETVRRRAERLRMRKRAQSLLAQANVVVLDDTLGKRWDQHKQSVLPSSR